ncbi:N-6 DNA methylase [Methanobacterium lacus]|uniref:site-specific DNA-methyltransferase (adenine-specific) n=1 Tax=Methanobacterium lacus (strain AL-21) TaxID=877455 RepID=F0T5W5_METLA|nr:class I SAM-dependent DNA methyltransferase [Methanobacterium lacus]ADZ09358.1 N-6 DNA methylase [Methanobacterium lacus]
MLDPELKSKINKLWDMFWSSGISNPLQAIEQMSYLIYMKRLDDDERAKEQNAKFSEEEYESLFKDCSDCRWSKWNNMAADEMLIHVREKVFPFLRDLGDENSLYRRYMKDAVFAIPTGSLLVETTSIIDEMHIKEQNLDTKGDIYEYLLSELKTSGKNGQFRTPRHIIQMMVKIVDPKVNEIICDPACGTAGFLVNSYRHILKANTSQELIKIDDEGQEYNFKGDKLSKSEYLALKNNSLFGFDFDQTMVRISLMNLMMHGISNPQIDQINTISMRYNQNPNFDVVLANPPFKGSINKDELNDDFSINTTKTEILFLELMYNILNIGGRCAVIVPQGVLFGNSRAHKSIRKKLLEDCRLDAVISMPSGVFRPYAGVSTGILIFTKGEPTAKVGFYDMEADGYTLDDKRTFIDGKGDIPDIIEKFKNSEPELFQDRKAKHFYVPYEEIKENDYSLSISNYKEIEYDEIEYESPDVIKEKILELEKKIIKGLEELDFQMNNRNNLED